VHFYTATTKQVEPISPYYHLTESVGLLCNITALTLDWGKTNS